MVQGHLFLEGVLPRGVRVLLQGDVYEQARDSRQRSPQQEDIGSHRSQEHPVSIYTTLP